MIIYAIYFVLPVFLIAFFEVLGNVIVNKYKINNFVFNGIIGFAVFLTVFQILAFPVAMFSLNFKYLLLVFMAVFIGSLYFIIRFRKCYLKQFSIKEVIFVIIVVLIFILSLLPNTIGDVMSYDTVTYVNMITGNIYADGIGMLGMVNGYSQTPGGYVLQGYYLLASCLYYLVNAVCNVIGIDFFYFTQHTWMYSLMLYFFFAEGIINIFKKTSQNVLSKVFMFVFFILFMGNFYWNSEQAFLGISYKMILVSYSGYFLYKYFDMRDNKYLITSMIFLISNIACANCNTTLAIILIFGIWLINKNTITEIKIYGVALLVPTFFLFYQLTDSNILFSSVPTTIILLVFAVFPKTLLLLENNKIKTIIGIFVASVLIVGSIIVSDNYLAFNGFLNNMSGIQDMTWDYTDFSTLWRTIANIIYILLIVSCIYVYRKNKYIICVSAIALIFFNPFAADLQNKYMIVFYRNYDIFINFFTLTLGVLSLDEIIKNKKITFITYITLILLSSYVSINQIKYHPGGQKWEILDEKGGYNKVLRMYNDEADTLRFVKALMSERNNKDIKVISSIYQTRCEFPYFKTLYNRNNWFNEIKNEYELYKVFFNEEYYGDIYAPGKGDYNNICKYISDANYDLIIQKKDKLYYDKVNDSYYSITYLIDKCGSLPIYENDSFAVYEYNY